jgi:hypothetical protein
MKVQEEIAKEAEERIYNNAVANEEENENISDDEGDDDYQLEVPDVGRNALIALLLNAASAIDENNADNDDN